jgi:S-adenosylmethionine/arginine decarboxylase-like enzyme
VPAIHAHLTAEFIGVPPTQLSDAALLGGLLIAAASAAGLSGAHPPVVRERREGGVSAALVLEGGHLIVHGIPERQVLLLDVLAPSAHDFRTVVDVFARRLTARDVHSDTRTRG